MFGQELPALKDVLGAPAEGGGGNDARHLDEKGVMLGQRFGVLRIWTEKTKRLAREEDKKNPTKVVLENVCAASQT